jgi:Predicted membrane protein (DUF2232)
MRHDHVLSVALAVFCGVFSFFMVSLGAIFALPFLFLGYFAQLPFFLLGFFASYEDVLLGGAVASLLHFLFAGEGQLVTYVLLYVVPPVLFAYLLGGGHNPFQRSSVKRVSKKAVEPVIGHYFLLMACFLTIFCHFSFSHTNLEKFLGGNFHQFSSVFSKEAVSINQTVLPWVQHYFSGMISLSWMVMTVCNLIVARVLSRRFQKNPGSREFAFKYWQVAGWHYWLLVASLVGIVFFPGDLSLMAKNLTLISLIPFLLEGFSVVHRIYRTFSKGVWGIVPLYGLLVLLVWPLLALVCLGLFEPWIHVRRRLGDPS